MAREVNAVREETGPGGLPFLVVDSERCQARLTPYGAQVCAWTPAGQRTPVVFLSPHAVFGSGKAIRGGVPVCFPWFASHPTEPGKPAHGFARTRMWQVGDVLTDHTGDVALTFHLAADAATRALWPGEFVASLAVTLGTTLTMTFTAENRDADELAYEVALHTYLTVGDVARARVHGLERTRFIDKVDGMREKISGDGPITFSGEVDRVFVDTAAPCVVDDPVLGRRVRIEKSGSPETVVWTPGPVKGPAIPDVGDAWTRFICVETAHCRPHTVRLGPGARHAMTARILIDPA